MPTIVNPYKYRTGPSALGEAIKRAGQTMFGDTLTPAINREKLYAAERENVETENLMKGVHTGGNIDWSVVGPAIIGSGYDPKDFNNLVLGRAANTYGSRDQRTQNAQVGAGGAFSSTAEAFDIGESTKRRGQDVASADRRYGFDLASADRRHQTGVTDERERWKFEMTPQQAYRNGEPVFVPRRDVYDEGVAPILSDSERGPASEFNDFNDLYLEQYAVDPANPTPEEVTQARDYAIGQVSKSKGRSISVGPDGTVSIEEGGVGGLTNNVRSGVQKASIEAENFLSLADMADGYLSDPANANLFGITGSLRQMGQGVVEAANNMALTLGYESSDQLANQVREEAAQTGVASLLPEVYDPGLDAVDALWGMLVYKGAAALAGQEGRSISDKDIVMFRQIFGDPKALLSSQKSLQSKLDIAKQIVDAGQRVRKNAMTERPLGEGRGQPSAPAGQGTQSNPVVVRSEEEALALPPGTWVRMGDSIAQVPQ